MYFKHKNTLLPVGGFNFKTVYFKGSIHFLRQPLLIKKGFRLDYMLILVSLDVHSFDYCFDYPHLMIDGDEFVQARG